MSRIVLFSSHFPPHVGGVERYTENLAAALARRGHRVTVVTTDIGGADEGELRGFQLFRLRCGSVMQGRYPIPLACGANRDVWRVLRAQKPEGVIICCRFYPLSLLAARFARRQGLTPLVIEHGSDYLRVGKPLADSAFHLYEHVFTALLKRYRPAFYGVSRACCRWLETFGIRAEGTLYNAIDMAGLKRLLAEPAADYRALCGAEESTTLVAFTGRLLEQKHVRELIGAVESLKDCDLRLLIAGEGELAREVAAHASDTVFPLGQLEFPHVAALLAAADVFCLPSDTEGFSSAVLEAAGAGCYIAATPSGGTVELLPDSSCGALLADSRPETIAAALRWACGHPLERRQAAERARARVEEYFTWEKTVDAAETALGL